MTLNTNRNMGGGVPPAMSPQSVSIFREGISLILSRWSALQMAVENEWGGRGSRAIAEQLISDIYTWFTQSREPLYLDDLENILDEAMLSLNTMAEDGSIDEVAEKLMIMHEECLEGNYQSIVALRETRPQPHAHVRQVVNNDEDDDSSDDDNDSSDMMTDAPESVRPANIMTNEARPRETTVTEDGWTVVSSRRGRGRQN